MLLYAINTALLYKGPGHGNARSYDRTRRDDLATDRMQSLSLLDTVGKGLTFHVVLIYIVLLVER